MKAIHSILFKILGLVFIVAAMSCQKNAAPMDDIDLLVYGYPIKLMAPDSAVVKVKNLSFMKDITVIHEPSNYNVQILVSQVSNKTKDEFKQDILRETKQNPYFAELIEDYENGFIFKNEIDSIPSFDFRMILFKGEYEYIYQTGLSANFSLEEVQRMYQAVDYPKK